MNAVVATLLIFAWVAVYCLYIPAVDGATGPVVSFIVFPGLLGAAFAVATRGQTIDRVLLAAAAIAVGSIATAATLYQAGDSEALPYLWLYILAPVVPGLLSVATVSAILNRQRRGPTDERHRPDWDD
ncbi:MAG: hypothetical protein AAFY56_24275 [Pseudomonadota bacterium]